MKVGILSTYEKNGGAALAAHRLFQGLRELEVDAKLFTLFRENGMSNPHVISTSETVSGDSFRDQALIQQYTQTHRKKHSDNYFSMPQNGHSINFNDQMPDVLNLHWVAGFIGLDQLRELKNLGIPLVISVHDLWLVAGGCHYKFECDQHVLNCKECPQVSAKLRPFVHQGFLDKLEIYKEMNPVIVCASEWMRSQIKAHPVLRNFRIELIRYGFECDIFHAKGREQSKQALNISANKTVLTLSAHNFSERRKGIDFAIKALKLIPADLLQKKVTLLAIGGGSETLKGQFPGLEIICQPFSKDLNRLADFYRATDVYILPSYEDNMPNSLFESMGCGAVVVGFKAGGVPDILTDEKNGFLANEISAKALSAAILRALSKSSAELSQMSAYCADFINKNYRLTNSASKYSELFKELLDSKNPVRKVKSANARNSSRELLDFILLENAKKRQWRFPLEDRILNFLARQKAKRHAN